MTNKELEEARARCDAHAEDCRMMQDRVQRLVEANKYFREHLAPYMDSYNNDAIEICGDCGSLCAVVRPGKTQCRFCEAIDEIERFKQHLGDILARIHRDGGQYIREHGWDKAVEDADGKVADSHVEVEDLREKLKGAQEIVDDYIREIDRG